MMSLLIPIVDREWTPSQGSHQLTAEEVHRLSQLLEPLVRMGEALVEYAIAIAGRPHVN